MKRAMRNTTMAIAMTFAILIIVYSHTPSPILLTLLITAGTFLYHLAMRLIVGTVIDHRFHNDVDITKPCFQIGNRERKLYRYLHVKAWKKHLPTYDPDQFDITKHSLKEIAGASAQAEMIHLAIALLSFLPIIASIWFGDTWIFLITSILASLIDLSFVIVQRYNRDRIYRLLEHEGRIH